MSFEVCKKCQKLLDISNSHVLIPRDDWLDPIVSWDDGVLSATEESIQQSINDNNAIIDHFENCSHKGCKQLMENWKPYERYTDRESMLTGKEPLI